MINKSYSTTYLLTKPYDDSLQYGNDGKVTNNTKFAINNAIFNIKNSKIIGKQQDTFETMLFLPEGEGRQGEGGLRTKGYFKHSYNMVDGEWWIVDSDNNPVIPAPEDIQFKIKQYLTSTAQHQTHSTYLPLITVITVVYNGAKYLEETILSVINQTYPNVEYIIIDGGSTDGTIDIIKKYEDYIDYWVSEKDKGIYDAMNKGITLCFGEIVGIINSDDWYEKDAFDKVINSMNQNEGDIYYGNMTIISEKTKQELEKRYTNEKKLYFGMYLNHPSTFVKLKVYKKFDLFDAKNFKIAADYDLLLRNKINGSSFFLIDDCLAYMRDNGVSVKTMELTKMETEMVRKKNLSFIIYHFTKFIKFIRKTTK